MVAWGQIEARAHNLMTFQGLKGAYHCSPGASFTAPRGLWIKPWMATLLHLTLGVWKWRFPNVYTQNCLYRLSQMHSVQLSLITGLTKHIISSNNFIVLRVVMLVGLSFWHRQGQPMERSVLRWMFSRWNRLPSRSPGNRCSTVSMRILCHPCTWALAHSLSINSCPGMRDLRGIVDISYNVTTHIEDGPWRKSWTFSGEQGTALQSGLPKVCWPKRFGEHQINPQVMFCIRTQRIIMATPNASVSVLVTHRY